MSRGNAALGAALIVALSILVGVATTRAGEAVRVGEARIIELPPRAADATHELALYAYVFRGSRWDTEALPEALVAAARLLAQCHVALGALELRAIDAPPRFRAFATASARELLRAFDAPRPGVFFVDDTRNRPAFDAEAIGLSNASTRPELANTVWVAHGARDLVHALAHELVHVLSDSGEHSSEPPNLMRAETAADNDRLTRGQCDLIRSRGAANGLLKPREVFR